MLELGQHSGPEHNELLKSLAGTSVNVLLFGNEMQKQYQRMEKRNNIEFFADKRDMTYAISEPVETW
jgi:UDP-N-acetylmuramyl pentapeptide synthase